MFRTRSLRASNITRSAISAVAFALAAACASKVSPPVPAIADVGATHLGVPVQLDGSNSVSLRANTPLAYAWSFTALPPRSQVRFNDAHLAKPSFTPDVAGTFVVQLTVDDGILASSVSVPLDVKDDCRPTIASLTQSPEKPNIGQTAGISATAATTCGTSNSIVSYQWSVFSAPAGSKAQILLAGTQHPSFTPDVRGDYDLVVQVTDSLGLTSDTTDRKAHLTYSTKLCGDNSPVVASITTAPVKPDVASPVQLSALVTDADSDPSCGLPRSFSYAWSLLELPTGSTARLNNTALKAPSFTPDLHGHYVVALTVTDNLGRASGQALQPLDTSTCGDATPVATALPAGGVSVASGTSVQLHTNVTDTDNPAYNGVDPAGGSATTGPGCGLALTYTYQWQIVSAPKGSKAQLNNATLANPSFLADIQGQYVLSVVVIASTGHASSPSFVTVTALPCGTVPLTAAIVVPSGQPAIPAATSQPLALTATVNDPNSTCATVAPLQYAWSIVSAPAGSKAVLSGNTGAGISPAASPSLTPDLPGDYLVGLSVTDQLGLRVIASAATVRATACNQPLLFAPTGGISTVWTPPANAPDAGPATGQSVVLSANVTDPNAPGPSSACVATVLPLSYSWSIVAQPSGSKAALNNGSAASPSFAPDVAGTYTVRLVVSDAAGNKSPAITQDIANIASCTQPLVVTSISAPPGGTNIPVSLSAVVNDPNFYQTSTGTPTGCPLTDPTLSYAWSIVQQPNGSRASLNNAGAATPSFVPDLPGSYVVQLVVTDAIGMKSAAAQQTVAVANCNQPLAFAANGGITYVWTPPATSPSSGPQTGQIISLSANVTDPNAPAAGSVCVAPVLPLSYAWSLIAQPLGSTAALSNSSNASPSLTPDLPGTYTVRLVVTDAAGNKSPATSVDIANVGSCTSPLSGSIPALVGPLGTGAPIALSALITDPNLNLNTPACPLTNGLLSYSWSFVALPNGSHATLNNANASNPSFVADVSGNYGVQLIATDAIGMKTAALQQTVTVGVTCSAALTGSVQSTTAVPAVGQPVGLSVANLVDPNAVAACGGTKTPFSYSWQIIGQPAGSRAVLNNPAAAAPSFTPDVTGVYTVQATVTDVAGNKGVFSATVTVSSTCTQPLSFKTATPATAANATVSLGATASPVTVTLLWANVTDTNDLKTCTGSSTATAPVYTFQWAMTARPPKSAASIIDPSGTTNGTTSNAASFVADVAGTYVLLAKVTDQLGNSATTQVNVPVAGCGTTPAVTAKASAANVEVGQQVGLTALVSDPSPSNCGSPATAPFSYAWTLAFNGPASGAGSSNAVIANPRNAQTSFTPDVASNLGWTATVLVTDALGLQAPATTPVVTSFSCAMSPPSITPAIGATYNLGQQVSLSATPNFAAGCTTPPPVSYSWTFDQLPVGSASSFNNASIASPSFLADKANGISWVPRVTIVDLNTGATSTATTTIKTGSCGSLALQPGAKVVSQSSTGNGAVATSTTPSSPTGLGTFSVSSSQANLQFNGTLNTSGGAFVDPNNGCVSPITYNWSIYALPPGSQVSISPSNAAQPTMVLDKQGTYVLSLVISDGPQTSAPIYMSVMGGP